jgi:hypothetical protein
MDYRAGECVGVTSGRAGIVLGAVALALGPSVWRSSTTRSAASTTNTEATVEFVPFSSSPGWAEPAVADGLAATAGLLDDLVVHVWS